MEIKRLFRKDFENYFKFAFVRNPWERICSSYFYIKKDKNHPAHFETLETKDVNEFISREIYIEKSQTQYIFDNNDNQIVDFVGRYENLQNDFKKVLDLLKIDLRLEKLNSGSYKNYKEILNQKSIEIINERYKKEIKIFKYIFWILINSERLERIKFLNTKFIKKGKLVFIKNMGYIIF